MRNIYRNLTPIESRGRFGEVEATHGPPPVGSNVAPGTRGAQSRGFGPHLVAGRVWPQLNRIDLYFQQELDYDV